MGKELTKEEIGEVIIQDIKGPKTGKDLASAIAKAQITKLEAYYASLTDAGLREEVAMALVEELKTTTGFGFYEEGHWGVMSHKARRPYLHIANLILSLVTAHYLNQDKVEAVKKLVRDALRQAYCNGRAGNKYVPEEVIEGSLSQLFKGEKGEGE